MAFYKSRDEYDRKKKERAKCREDPKRKPEQCQGCTWVNVCSTEGTQDWLSSGSKDNEEESDE